MSPAQHTATPASPSRVGILSTPGCVIVERMRNFSAFPAFILLATFLGSACASEPTAPPPGESPGPTPSVARTPIGELPEVDVDAVMAHTRALSSDQFEGRAPGSKGEELTVAYLI